MSWRRAAIGMVAIAAWLAACGDAGDAAPAEVTDPGVTTDVVETADPGDAANPGDTGTETPADPGKEDVTDAFQPDVPVATGVNYVVVYQDDLEDAAKELAAFRESTGFKAQVVKVSDLVPGNVTAYYLLKALHDLLGGARAQLGDTAPLFLVLLGNAPAKGDDATARIPSVPCTNDFTAHLGDCQTDNTYADLDGDGIPDVAVGRIPAGTLAEARAYLDKEKAYEAGYQTGVFNRRVSVYTGQANFSAQIDSMLEMAVMEGLKRVSHAFDIVGAYDNPTSDYYYMPFDDKVIDLFNEGSLMVVYVGHGGNDYTEGLTTDQIDRIHCTKRLPFVFLFACYAGNYVGTTDSVAVTLVGKADGAITAFGATDISHPYGNAVMAYEVQRAVLDQRPPTLGEAVVLAKRGVIENSDDFRVMMDGFASSQPDLDAAAQARIRVQHLDMYNLLGDPAVPMHYPHGWAAFGAGLPTTGVPVGNLHVQGLLPGLTTGKAWVTLETERDTFLGVMDPVDQSDPDQATVQANWAKANDKVAVQANVDVVGGAFQADLDCPASLPGGAYYVKVYADDGTTDAYGFAALQ